MNQTLAGLRVLDFSWVWSGPMVTSILADYGAEIIKVEHQAHLDPGRLRGRAIRNGQAVEGPEYEVTPYFNQMNHGKRSITVDITSDEGRRLIRELVATCDVVVENMRPGKLARHGLGYEELSAINPSLIMLSMSMAGQDGPLRDLKGYASIMSAMAGVESLVGYDQDDVVGMFTPAFGDPNGASHAMAVLLAALYRRGRSEDGRGVCIDLSQIEAMLAVLRGPIVESEIFGEVRVPANLHPAHVPYGHFPAAGTDRWVAIAVRTDEEWRALCSVATSSKLLQDSAGLDAAQRRERRLELEDALSAWTRTFEPHRLVAVVQEVGVPAAVVNGYQEMVAALRRHPGELCAEVGHPYLGEQTTFFVPWRLDGETGGKHRHAPLLGSDSEAVRKELAARDSSRPADDYDKEGVL